jgi:hypothetical protein
VLGLPPPVAIERRKKKSAGFDIAGALEQNLDRYPTKDVQLTLIKRRRSSKGSPQALRGMSGR